MKQAAQIPGSWIDKKLQNVCEFSQGVQVDLSKQEMAQKDGFVPFLRIENYTQSSDDLRYVEDIFDAKKHVAGDDVVIVRYGATAGFVGRGKSGVLANNLFRVIPDESLLTKDYLYIKLKEYKAFRYFQTLMFGGAMPALSFGMVGTLPLVLPPLSEQRAIAELLSTWDEAIEKTDRLIQVKRMRFRRLLQELILEPKNTEKNDGWNEVKLGQICKVTKGKQLNVAHMNDDGAYYALNGGVGPSGRTDDWNTETETITISEGGNSCGYVNYNTERFWSGGHCYSLLNLKETVDKKYLYFYLKMNEPKLMKLRVGSGLPNIQKKDVDKFLVAFPSLDEQQQIAQSLSSARREIDLLKQLVDKYKTQKRGLMQKMLTGEWRVKPEIVNQYMET